MPNNSAHSVTSCVASKQDPLQFAYKRKRGTDDAVLTLLNTVTKHLSNPKGYAKILFVDFNSAFNSMKTHLLLKRLVDLNINQGLVLWIRNFLSCRPQIVCVRGVMSDVLTVSNGCPQSCSLPCAVVSTSWNLCINPLLKVF